MSWYFDKFEDLKGKVLKNIRVWDEQEIYFYCDDGSVYKLYHYQSCCESVYVEDIIGDLDNLIGEPIVMAEEINNIDMGRLDEYDESYTWTFYKLATVKGYVTIRWYGTSNGYYSEEVEFVKLDDEEICKIEEEENKLNINIYIGDKKIY